MPRRGPHVRARLAFKARRSRKRRLQLTLACERCGRAVKPNRECGDCHAVDRAMWVLQ